MEFFRNLVANKIVGPLLLGIVILGMAVWGIEDIFSGGIGSNIIKAGERGITQQGLDRKFESYLANVRDESPGNAISRQQATEQGLLDQLFNVEASRLINLGYAREIGADASAQALTDAVRDFDAFKNPITGAFDSAAYRQALARNRLTVDDFETDIEDSLTLDYLRDGITGGLVAPSPMNTLQAIYDGESRRISYMRLNEASLPDPVSPTDEDIRAFYEDRKDAFREPERRVLSLLSLSAEDFIHQVTLTEEDILSYYEATKGQRLATPEKRTFLQAIYTSETAALDGFGTLAGGGDLSDASPATLETRTATATDVGIEAFREAIFAGSARDGTVVGPFESAGRWIVGRLDGIEPGTPKSFEETREEVEAELALDNAEALFYDALNRFDDLIGQGLSLEEIGAAFGAPVLSFAPVDARGVTADGTPILPLIQAREAFAQAFALPANSVGDRYDGEDSIYLLSIDNVIDARVPEFEEVEDRAREGLVAVRASEALQTAAEAVKSTVESGISTLEEQSVLYATTVEAPDAALQRTSFDPNLPRSVLQAAFTLESGIIAIAPGEVPGEAILVRVDSVEQPNDQTANALAAAASGRLSSQLTGDLLFAFEQDLRQAVDLETNDRAFAAYKAQILDAP